MRYTVAWFRERYDLDDPEVEAEVIDLYGRDYLLAEEN